MRTEHHHRRCMASRSSPSFPWRRRFVGSAAVLVLALGCLERRDNEAREDNQCTACHGGTSDGREGLVAAAPPTSVRGADAASPQADAHAAHLWRRGAYALVECTECHIVPKQTYDDGHVDSALPAEVRFGELARKGEVDPTYEPATSTCRNTYCHGTGAPVWSEPWKGTDTCGSCHGYPPRPPHPQDPDCARCHGEVVADGGVIVRPELHVNGSVEVLLTACNACHGTGELGAPPPDLGGNTQTSEAGVGSHQLHLTASSTHGAVLCQECHVVPESVEAAGHLGSGPPAEVVFGELASRGERTPEYDGAAKTCAGTYCHGSAIPDWTAPRSGAQACGTCHGLPPPAPHPDSGACFECHGTVMASDGSFAAPELHVNGQVESSSGSCDACHGTGDKGSPPPDLSGEVNDSAPGVGAHERHLEQSIRHAAVPCEVCHSVPERFDAPGHLDDSPGAEVRFTGLAVQGGFEPSYSPAEHTCSDTYCHGTDTPVWTEARAPGRACGSCHGVPPPAPHPANSQCAQCHSEVMAADSTFVAPERHVDGVVDVDDMPCNACHGQGTMGAPPPDVSGGVDTSAVGVGAHGAHLNASATHHPVPCATCHLVPATVNSPGHLDGGSAEVSLSGLGEGGTYSPSTRTCSDAYCHGGESPRWTEPRSSAETCGSCHGLPPPPPHPALSDCALCHRSVVDSSLEFIDGSLHINGVVDF